jgi:ribosomal protein L40E
MAVRNPLAGFGITILAAMALSAIFVWPVITFVPPYIEFRTFVLGFLLFGAGVLAARSTYLGSLGFLGGYIGAFVGFYIGESLFWWNTYPFLLALGMALPCGLGGLASGKLGVLKIERASRVAQSYRRCKRCGARVGPQAEKCWSCKAALTL